MVRRFSTPMTDEDLAILCSLPKHDGLVTDPRFLTGAVRAELERELLTWCESHPGRDWPQWVAEWHLEFKTQQRINAPRSQATG